MATGLMAAIGDISRFKSPQKLLSYFGLNPRVRQSGLGAAHHGRISKMGRSHARAMLLEAAWAAKAPGPMHAFFVRVRARRGHLVAKEADGVMLAYADEGEGLLLGATEPRRPQDAQYGIASWPTADKR
nr:MULTISPECIES: transposase [unclassified Rhizobium]